MRAIVIGGTGACGHPFVEALAACDAVERVTALGRRDVEVVGDKVVNVRADIFALDGVKDAFANHDVAFCAPGTTRHDAGSFEAFRRVDYDAVVKFAQLAKESGIERFGLISSTGANEGSWFGYMKVKGEAERAITELGFKTLAIFRPGLLDRGDKARLKERIALPSIFGIPTKTVAQGSFASLHTTSRPSRSPSTRTPGSRRRRRRRADPRPVGAPPGEKQTTLDE